MVILTLMVGIVSSPTFAAEQRSFQIPAGPADRAVRQFVEQAGMSVIYEAGRLSRYKTRAVKGKYERLQALRILLDGTGLEFEVMSHSRYISVNPQAHEPTGPRDDTLPVVRISARASPDAAGLMPPNVSVLTVSSTELSQQGFTNISEFLHTLTQNQGTGAYEGTSYLREAPTNIAYGSGLNLYGIGQRATLVLINGRRLAPSGSAGSFTDVLNLPISAVDHIDLMSDGASTIYGADAVGGVVNFVLRDGYSRPMTTVSIGHLNREDLAGNDFSQSYTKSGDRWRGMAAMEYYYRSELPASDRSQATSNLTPWGGSNFNTPFGNPGTLLAANGTYWQIPSGQNGTALTPADLVKGQNLYDRHVDTWILPWQERLSALASGSYDFSDGARVFLDALFSRRWIKTNVGPFTTDLLVPSSNPFYVNPIPGNTRPVQVLYGFGKDLGSMTEQGTVDSGQLALGLEYALGESWNLRLTEGYTFDNQFETESNLVNFSQLAKYLAIGDPSVAFNPFGDGSSTNPATLAQIRATGSLEYRSAFESVNAEVFGSLPLLPAGDLTLRTGYEFRLQTFRSTVSPGFDFAGPTFDEQRRQRLLHAVYAQTTVPVWSDAIAPGSAFDLNLTGGLRYEHFSDVGSALVPSLGFSFDLSGGLSFTGTWSRMFRPPNLPDLNESLNYGAVYPLADPKSPSGYTTALVWGGNNASLSPETAHSWMLGLKLSPPFKPNLAMELQYFNIVSFDQVLPTQVLPLNLFSDPQYSYLYTRMVTSAALSNICSRIAFMGVPGACQSSNIGAIVDLRLRSAETVRTDGLDLRSAYAADTPIGILKLNLQTTYVLHFEEALTPGGESVSFRNTPHNPTAFRLRAAFGWENQHFFVAPAVNLQGSYKDNTSTPSRPVGSWTTWDLVMGYKLGVLDKHIGGDTQISLRGFNIFNKQPPFLNNDVGSLGYDPENADLLGRRLSLKIEREW